MRDVSELLAAVDSAHETPFVLTDDELAALSAYQQVGDMPVGLTTFALLGFGESMRLVNEAMRGDARRRKIDTVIAFNHEMRRQRAALSQLPTGADAATAATTGDDPEEPHQYTAEGGKPTPRSDSPRRKRMPQEEVDVAVSEWLRVHAPINPAGVTRDGIADAIGCSTGAVSKSPAWIAFVARRDANKPTPGREVQLTDGMLAVLPAESDAALKELIAQQKADDRRDARQNRRRHKDD